ncbi:MAG: ParB/RepB/Spo0J family partition protein [Eubacterium sp.]|nr:ParB/RepB/Spo0J family partition protein [Eubacterium sp.]
MAKARGLGRGLKALIPDEALLDLGDDNDTEASGDAQNTVLYLSLNRIRPDEDQPRKYFNRERLEELAASIKEHGVIQPLVVRPENDGYTIIAGERRWRAATIAGLKEVPVIIRNFSQKEILEIALIENVQRENLNPIEEAAAYNVLINRYEMTQEEISDRIGKSRTTIANMIRMLKLPKEVRQEIFDGRLSPGHAKALLSLENNDQIVFLCKEIIGKDLSVRETEKRVKSLKKPAPPIDQIKIEDRYIIDIEDRLKYQFGTKVRLKGTETKGKIEVEYYSLDDLNRILDILGYEKDGGKDEQ